jgi:hypothetical protein
MLELREREMDEPGCTSRHTPQVAGITIVIETRCATAKVLNPAPVIEHEPSQHTYPSVD